VKTDRCNHIEEMLREARIYAALEYFWQEEILSKRQLHIEDAVDAD